MTMVQGRSPKSAIRSGISLLEVLVSIFVLSVGMLSVTALIPAGQVQVLKGVIEDRRVTISQLGFAEGQARGVFRPFVTTGGTTVHMWMRTYDPAAPRLVDGAYLRDNIPDLPVNFGRPVLIDPMGTAAASTVAQAQAIDNFPYAPPDDPNFPYDYPYSGVAATAPIPANWLPSGPPYNGIGNPSKTFGPVMKRLTIRSAASGAAGRLPRLLASERFVNRDDLTFVVPADPELGPVGAGGDGWQQYSGFGLARNANNDQIVAERTGDPRYSWMYTVVPLGNAEYLVSTVVFRDRDLRIITQHSDLDGPDDRFPERMVQFAWAGGGPDAFGGGEATLLSYVTTDPALAAIDLHVQVGDWIMVRGYRAPAGVPLIPMFRWYRVRSVDDVIGTSRIVSLEGPDWRGVVGASVGMTATLMPNIISVTERVIRLEE